MEKYEREAENIALDHHDKYAFKAILEDFKKFSEEYVSFMLEIESYPGNPGFREMITKFNELQGKWTDLLARIEDYRKIGALKTTIAPLEKLRAFFRSLLLKTADKVGKLGEIDSIYFGTSAGIGVTLTTGITVKPPRATKRKESEGNAKQRD